MEKAVITVLGYDKKAIIYNITKVLAECDVNILDLSQTILQEYFTMVMLVDIADCNVKFEELQKRLHDTGVRIGLNVRIQHQQIFDSMHSI